MPKNVVSLSLFRHPACDYNRPDLVEQQGEWAGLFYERCLPAIIRGYLLCYPGWEIRIHHDESLYASAYGPALFRLHRAGMIRLVYMGKARTLGQGSLWRFAPLADSEVDLFVTRDIDSMPSPREAGLVREWIEEGSTLHCIHDAPVHGGLMTGMLGIRRNRFVARVGLVGRFNAAEPDALHAWGERQGLDMNVKEHDQTVLNRLVRSALAGSIMFHQGPTAPTTVGETCHPVSESYRGTFPFDVPELTAEAEARLCENWCRLTRCIGAPFDPAPVMEFLTDHVVPEWGGLDRVAKAERGFSFQTPPGDQQRVLLATDANPVYAFFLPLVAACWRSLGFTPTVLLVGGREDPARWWNEDPMRALVLEWAMVAGAEVRFIASAEGFMDSTVAQCCRITAGSIAGLRDGDYVLTGDVDMIPLPKMPAFLAQGMPDAEFHLFHGYAYAHEPEPHFPLCYMGGTVASWRKYVPDNLATVLGSLGARESWDSASSWAAWNHDEKWASKRMAAHRDFEGHVQKIRRDPDQDRVDRAWWDRSPPAAVCVDCHALRPGYTPENWPRVLAVLSTMGDEALQAAMNRYRDAFVKVAGVVTE